MKTFKERLLETMPPIRMEGFGDMEPAVLEALVHAYEIGARAVLLLLAEELVENRRLYRTHNEASAIQGAEHEDWLRTRAKELSDG